MARFEFYKQSDSMWYWKHLDAQEQIMNVSSQGYARCADCLDSATQHEYKYGTYATLKNHLKTEPFKIATRMP